MGKANQKAERDRQRWLLRESNAARMGGSQLSERRGQTVEDWKTAIASGMEGRGAKRQLFDRRLDQQTFIDLDEQSDIDIENAHVNGKLSTDSQANMKVMI